MVETKSNGVVKVLVISLLLLMIFSGLVVLINGESANSHLQDNKLSKSAIHNAPTPDNSHFSASIENIHLHTQSYHPSRAHHSSHRMPFSKKDFRKLHRNAPYWWSSYRNISMSHREHYPPWLNYSHGFMPPYRFAGWNDNNHSYRNINFKKAKISVDESKYTPHAPIRINSNADFTSANGVIGGSGTKDDPYIISGWDIDAHGAGAAIYIGNTTVYFVVKNCYLHNASYHSDLYFEGDGITLYNVTNGNLENNNCSNNGWDGIGIWYSSNNTISSNICSNNRQQVGINMWSSSNNVISNNTCSNNWVGIGIGSSSNNNRLYGNKLTNDGIVLGGCKETFTTQDILTNNTVNGKPVYYYKNVNMRNATVPENAGQVILGNVSWLKIENLRISNASIAIEIGYSSNITIRNNTCSNNSRDGIGIWSSNNTISNNNCSNNGWDGIEIGSSSNTISNNTCSNNSRDGIGIWSSSNTISNNNCSNNGWDGIEIGSSSNTISNNNCSNNGWDGIGIVWSSNNTISNNTCSNNSRDGIGIWSSSDNVISNNNCSNNGWDGIDIEYSSNNVISNNNCSNNEGSGIAIFVSSNNRLYGNKLANNGIVLWGGKETFTTQDIPTNNTVNGKPVYYYKNVNMRNATVPENAGQVILGNVSWLKIENLRISNASIAIEIGYSSNITIRNNTCSNNGNGIDIEESSSNTISNNTCSNNEGGGIAIWSSSDNVISNNNCSNNGWDGIDIEYSSNNVMRFNLISNNYYYGIYIGFGSGNIIYGNSFYYNHGSGDTYNSSHVQARDGGYDNYWNSSTGIGNYWHDWANNNNSNDKNGDGIVDWPYPIPGWAGAKDYYPLKNPLTPVPKLTPTAPRNLKAQTGMGYVNLTWEQPVGQGTSNISEYKIYRNGTLIATVPATQLWYNDTNVVPGVNYSYYVTAVNSVGESQPSNTVKATPTGAIPEFSSAWIAIITILSLLVVFRRRKVKKT
ncbi:Fibronectin type III domain protein [Aciduliprofundum boonei T469]|uniref:Fibronectin type III domain protein n=1 Tax=Aciduliprofundum boonei (strain DSM 19572 / T469) TaxID=439481 RepID=D3TD24_ACIB4|nr:Fibronectin type III domain protein [Aciduliprofundum boonei T469]